MDGADILHVDLDAFYASVEQLRDPSLAGRPVAVGGGVVLAASYEAKAFGVRSGMPGRRARELCPRIAFVSGHFEDYLELSQQVFEICESYTPTMEKISIDEAFLDVSGAHGLFGDSVTIAAEVRSRVRSEVGLPISAGVARTKFLAKVASQVAKPDGLVAVDPKRELDFLHPLPVGLIWGVGPVTRKKLADIGVHTIGELAQARPEFVRRRLGVAVGDQLHRLSWNVDGRSVQRHRTAGSIGAQSSFGTRRHDAATLSRVLLSLADRIGTRLRDKHRSGRTITVRVRFEDLQSVTRSVTLRAPISSTAALNEVAGGLAEKAIREASDGRVVNLFGISVSNLTQGGALQLELPLDNVAAMLQLAGSPVALDRHRLDEAVDQIRDKFGKDAVGAGSVSLGPATGFVPDLFRELAQRD